MKQPKHSLSLRLGHEIYTRLVKQANDEERSMNFIIVKALELYLPKGETNDN